MCTSDICDVHTTKTHQDSPAAATESLPWFERAAAATTERARRLLWGLWLAAASTPTLWSRSTCRLLLRRGYGQFDAGEVAFALVMGDEGRDTREIHAVRLLQREFPGRANAFYFEVLDTYAGTFADGEGVRVVATRGDTDQETARAACGAHEQAFAVRACNTAVVPCGLLQGDGLLRCSDLAGLLWRCLPLLLWCWWLHGLGAGRKATECIARWPCACKCRATKPHRSK